MTCIWIGIEIWSWNRFCNRRFLKLCHAGECHALAIFLGAEETMLLGCVVSTVLLKVLTHNNWANLAWWLHVIWTYMVKTWFYVSMDHNFELLFLRNVLQDLIKVTYWLLAIMQHFIEVVKTQGCIVSPHSKFIDLIIVLEVVLDWQLLPGVILVSYSF